MIAKTHATTTHAATKHVSIEKTHDPWKYHKRLQTSFFTHGTLAALVGGDTAAALLSVVIHVASSQATCLRVFARRAIARRIILCFHLRQLTCTLAEPTVVDVITRHRINAFDAYVVADWTIRNEHCILSNVSTRSSCYNGALILAVRISIVRARSRLS